MTKMEIDFPTRMYALLEKSGCDTEKEFAKRIGVTERTLEHYLHGRRLPSARNIRKIVWVCGCTADWLLGLEEKRG